MSAQVLSKRQVPGNLRVVLSVDVDVVRAQAGGGPLRRIPQHIVDDAPRQFATVTRGAGGNLAWPALLRKLDASNPGYAQ